MSRRSDTARGRARPKPWPSMWNVSAAVFLFGVAGFLVASLPFAGGVDGRSIAATLSLSLLVVALGAIALFKEGAGALRRAAD